MMGPVVPDPAPVGPVMRTVAGHVGVGIPTTEL
jgi:hypothetical protein